MRSDNNQEVPSTVVSEAARILITFSGATIIPDIPEYYRKYPALLRFLSAQKMPWLESKTLDGKIGEYIVMMRQAEDGENAHYLSNRETIKVSKKKVTRTEVLNIKLAPGGGACIRIGKEIKQ